MRKLNKAQSEEKSDHAQAIYEARDTLSAAMDRANERILEANAALASAADPTALEDAREAGRVLARELTSTIKPLVDELEGAIDVFNDWRSQIAADAQSYFDDRSEKWQESDAGGEYQEWISAWDEEITGDLDFQGVIFHGDDDEEIDTIEIDLFEIEDLDSSYPDEPGM